ncbi:MAG: hypothetical protein ING22_00070 [Burkholderiales bacterium]|jgi:transposase InsO family protein|nr:hypothetical protein [Burkholderiales bacterium]
MTYIPTWSGFLYLAMVLDVFSRKVVGWAFGDTILLVLFGDQTVGDSHGDPMN